MDSENIKKTNYDNGRFRLREESDYAIVDRLGDFAPIVICNGCCKDNGIESGHADRVGVLHLLNELSDTNPNEQRHYFLKYRLDELYRENGNLRMTNKSLKDKIDELYENDKILRKMMSQMSMNYQGITIQRDLYSLVKDLLAVNGHEDIVKELEKTSLDHNARNSC